MDWHWRTPFKCYGGKKTNWLEDIFVSCLNKKKKSTNVSKGKTLLTGVTVMVGLGWRQTLLSRLLPIYLLSSLIGWKHIHFWVISLFLNQCNLWAHLLLLLQRYYQSVPITESDGQILVGIDLEKKKKITLVNLQSSRMFEDFEDVSDGRPRNWHSGKIKRNKNNKLYAA